jgi:hypothetical protein
MPPSIDDALGAYMASVAGPIVFQTVRAATSARRGSVGRSTRPPSEQGSRRRRSASMIFDTPQRACGSRRGRA